MPRRKAAKVEVLPPEDTDQPTQRVREVKHKTEWTELHPVEEASEDADLDLTDDDAISEGKPRRRTPKNERDELRKVLAQNNVTPASQLKLSVERYLHSDIAEGGTWAETEYLSKYACTKEHITSEEYLDVARRYGTGTYRFTLRMQNKIVTAWDKRLGSITQGPVIQNANPNDPNSPQVIIQTTADGQQQPLSMRDIMKGQKEALKEHLEMTKLMREAYGLTPEQPQQQPRGEEEVLTTAILKQPEVIENVVGSVLKRFGASGKGDDEPWYADVVRDAVKSGQVAQIVQVAIDRIFNGFSGLFPGRQDNGQAQMVTAPLQNQAQPAAGDQQGQFISGVQERSQQMGADVAQTASGHAPSGSVAGDVFQSGDAPMVASTEEQALQLLLDHCRRNIPVKIACDRLIAYADAINEQAPHLSIDEYISMFAAMPVEAALEFVKTQPNGEAVASLSHAKAWTEELQRLIKEAGQEGEDA